MKHQHLLIIDYNNETHHDLLPVQLINHCAVIKTPTQIVHKNQLTSTINKAIDRVVIIDGVL